MIYIVSRGRPEQVKKNITKWLDFEVEKRFGLHVIVERNERIHYKEVLQPISKEIEVIPLKPGQSGVSYSRNTAFVRTWRQGLKSFIVSDDDLYVKDDPGELLKAARTKKTLGVGAMHSIYTLMYGLQPLSGVYMLKYGGFGYQCYALNTQNMAEVGAWDKEWVGVGQMDHGLFIKSVVQLGLLWRISTDVRFQPTLSEAVIGGGGIDTLLRKKGLKSRMHAWHAWHKLAYHRYPEYVNDPKKCKVVKSNKRCGLRYNWAKMVRDHCPPRISEYKGKVIPVGN